MTRLIDWSGDLTATPSPHWRCERCGEVQVDQRRPVCVLCRAFGDRPGVWR